MTNDSAIRTQITLQQGSADVEYGNLLSLPIGNGMLYVEPLYVKTRGENTFPQLKFVLLNFGQYVGFDATLPGAIKQLLAAAAAGQPSVQSPPPPGGTPPTGQPSNAAMDAALAQLDQAMKDLKAAQTSGDFTAYGKALQEVNDALNAYQAARGAQPPPSAPAASPTPSPSG